MAARAQKRNTPAQTVSLAEAKATFSAVIDSVEQERVSVTILRRGIPVAQIVPFRVEPGRPLHGSMRGTVKELGDIVGPTGEDWGMEDE